MSLNYDEKRSFYRMSVNCHIEFSELDNPVVHKGDGKDLSATGVKFVTDYSLKEGQKLNVTIYSMTQDMTSLSAKAKVMRIVKDGNRYIVGLSLEDVN
jgi:c-di-GMP-binding flagellar brake protein YcgR